MIQAIDLRELSSLEGPPRSFVSFYVSDRAGMNSLEQRAERVRSMLEDDAEASASFEKSFADLRELVDGNDLTGESGWALFSCAPLDFARGYAVPHALRAELRVARAPYLRPLANLQDEYQTFLVLAADASVTRVFEVDIDGHELVGQIRGDVKNRVRKGGWSQKRYSRRRDRQFAEYAKEVAELVAETCRRESIERIAILGADEAVRRIEDRLPSDIAARVVGAETFHLEEGEESLVQRAFELYFEEEREEEQRLWDRVRSEYLSGGLAVVGAGDVLKAAVAGRAEEILLTRNAKVAGTRCDACTNVFEGSVEVCPLCESEDVHDAELVDEIVRRAEATGASLEFADPIEGLTKVGEVAALLRY